MEISFNNLAAQWKIIESDVKPQLERLFETSAYINGPAVKEFEKEFSGYVGTKYAMGVSTGTDAIKLATTALQLKGNVGVIIPANTFIGTILGVEEALPNAEFILVDCDEYYQIDTVLLEQTLKQKRSSWDECLVVPVHLYGHCADMISIMNIAKEYNCKVLEDASQSHGTICENNFKTGSVGHIAAFSLYPGKNLGACGDGGIITTNDFQLAKNVELLRNYGSEKKYYYELKGYNNRLDTIQAIFLKEKLKHLTKWNELRNKIADLYNKNINNTKVIKPKLADYCKHHTYHIYCVRVKSRDKFMQYLRNNDIQCGIHYPVPIEETKPYTYLGTLFNNRKTKKFSRELVSLPMHPFMTQKEVEKVCKVINGRYWET